MSLVACGPRGQEVAANLPDMPEPKVETRPAVSVPVRPHNDIHRFDKRVFWSMTGALAASQIADTLTTESVISHGGHEQDPIFGPSRRMQRSHQPARPDPEVFWLYGSVLTTRSPTLHWRSSGFFEAGTGKKCTPATKQTARSAATKLFLRWLRAVPSFLQLSWLQVRIAAAAVSKEI